MSRKWATWAPALAVIFSLVLAPALAEAKGRKKKKKRKKAAVTAVNSAALAELMGPFKFGMKKKQVLKILHRQIKERTAEKIKETTDVYKQDKLRRDQKAEFKRIQKTFVKFEGKKTGWDVSIVDDQFAHDTGESMMVYWENAADSGKDQRRFFFFHDGELYKMFIALNSGMLKGEQRKFSFFKNVMQQRYGTAKVLTRKSSDGVESPVGLEWRGKKHHVQALDKLDFYGSFCLVVANPSVEKTLWALRKDKRKVARKDKVIESVIADPNKDDGPSLETGAGTVDSIIK